MSDYASYRFTFSCDVALKSTIPEATAIIKTNTPRGAVKPVKPQKITFILVHCILELQRLLVALRLLEICHKFLVLPIFALCIYLQPMNGCTPVKL